MDHSLASRVREMTVYAKTLPESRIHSDEQLANIVYDIVKKTSNNDMEQVSNEIRRLYYSTMY